MQSEKLEGKKLSWLTLAAALVLLVGMLPAASQPETRPAIYDPAADMKSLITTAAKTALSENKNILLCFSHVKVKKKLRQNAIHSLLLFLH